MADEELTPRPSDEPYQALYRRYRPQHFAGVRGQEHVTRALKNAVREGRVAHAYLFSGPRGTGKTSTARILAMALNCEAPLDGEPDGTCRSCTAIRSGASMDVFELDAASNRKLDEMRDLLSRVALGTPGRWKVYIIDEVHQLTPDAASALLKTLEEPPSHVIFVLATTDPQKVLPTILSRTQHFEFHLLDGDMLAALLEEINHDAGLGLSPAAVRLAAQKGRGSARDAESALEQRAAGGEPDDAAPVTELAEAIAERDASLVLQAVARAIVAGRDPRRLGSDLVERLRDAFLAVQAPSLVLLPAAETAELSDIARRMGLPLLVRSMELVGEALVDMRDSVDPRVTLEVVLVRLAAPGADTSPAAMLERIERLERALGEAVEGKRALAETGVAGHRRADGDSRRAGAAAPVVAEGDDSRVQTGRAAPGTATVASPLVAGEARGGRTGVGPPASALPPSALVPPEGAAQARAALGAFLRGGDDKGPSGGAPTTRPAPGHAEGPRPAVPGEGAGPAVATSEDRREGAHRGAPGKESPPSSARLPSRDELTKAWGDTVLGRLGRPGQVYMAAGRFTEVGDAAVFALPDAGFLARASKFVGEAEAALATYFGSSVPLRLVVDKGSAPPRAPAGAGPEEYAGPEKYAGPEEEAYDLDELVVAEEPALAAEERVLQAFPGAVLES